MLRILLWRLGLELWNLIACLPRGVRQRFGLTRPVHYFAFGANLDPAVLARRKIRSAASRDYLLEEHQLLFNQQGPFQGFGFASVEAAPGKMVYGRWLTLSRLDEIRMDYFELVPFLKKHRKVTVERDGKALFFYQATRPLPDLHPTPEYKQKILQAAERSPIIPEKLLEELRQTPVVDSLRPVTKPYFMLASYKALVPLIGRWKEWYDRACLRLFMRLYGLSLVDRFL